MVDKAEPFARAQLPGNYLVNRRVVASSEEVGISPGCESLATVFQDHEVALSGVDFIAPTRILPWLAVSLSDLHTAHLDEGEPEHGVFYGSEDIAGWWARSGSGRRGIAWPEHELHLMRTYCLTSTCRLLEILENHEACFELPSPDAFVCYRT